MTRVDEMTKQTLNCSLKNDYLQMVKITRWTDLGFLECSILYILAQGEF